MKRRTHEEFHLRRADRDGLQWILQDRQLPQYAAHRARALLALEAGEPAELIEAWTGLQRMALWYLQRRYRRRGIEVIWDAPRSGRPVTFSPSRAGAHRADGLHRARGLRTAPGSLGLPQPR